jgi:Spy/CpxP family protein refolding chaperone
MTSNQSWTSWILDSYASSVHTTSATPDAESSDPIEDEPPAAPPLGSRSPSASSTIGPFVKTGRGGAGNFTWQSEQPRDVEAQRQSSLTDRQRAAAQIEHLDTAEALNVSKIRKQTSSQYQRVGIGGAGNLSLVQSNEVQSPRSPSFSRSTSSPLSATFPKLHYGRGGSGNYAAAVEGEKKIEGEKEYAERIVAMQLRVKVEQDVENLLRPPQGALLSEGRRREGVV